MEDTSVIDAMISCGVLGIVDVIKLANTSKRLKSILPDKCANVIKNDDKCNLLKIAKLHPNYSDTFAQVMTLFKNIAQGDRETFTAIFSRDDIYLDENQRKMVLQLFFARISNANDIVIRYNVLSYLFETFLIKCRTWVRTNSHEDIVYAFTFVCDALITVLSYVFKNQVTFSSYERVKLEIRHSFIEAFSKKCAYFAYYSQEVEDDDKSMYCEAIIRRSQILVKAWRFYFRHNVLMKYGKKGGLYYPDQYGKKVYMCHD